MSKLPADTLYRICDNMDCTHTRPKESMIQIGNYYFCSGGCIGKERYYESHDTVQEASKVHRKAETDG